MTTLAHEPDATRYTLRDGDTILALVDYTINGNRISLTHTFTQPAHRGKGLAAQVVEYAINDIAKNTELKVLPMCWYAAEWFEKNPDRAELLSR